MEAGKKKEINRRCTQYIIAERGCWLKSHSYNTRTVFPFNQPLCTPCTPRALHLVPMMPAPLYLPPGYTSSCKFTHFSRVPDCPLESSHDFANFFLNTRRFRREYIPSNVPLTVMKFTREIKCLNFQTKNFSRETRTAYNSTE